MPSSDDDSSEDGPEIPTGVLRSRGGWADEYNLEVEHQRERLRAAGTDDSEHNATSRAKTHSHAAVDLSQFRNEEVGKGYQAKHVMRQKEATTSATGIVDMTGGKFSGKGDGGGDLLAAKKRRSVGDGSKESDGRKRPSGDVRLETYMKCKGMRDFMKEIDKTLMQR